MAILDFYDDPQGEVLKSRLPRDRVPDFIKTAAYLSDGARDALPDDLFALVMVDRESKLKKYACVDKGNTALSVMYFLENHHKLSSEAQKTAAANLTVACDWYGLSAPAQLRKLASGDGFSQGYNQGAQVRALNKAKRRGFTSVDYHRLDNNEVDVILNHPNLLKDKYTPPEGKRLVKSVSLPIDEAISRTAVKGEAPLSARTGFHLGKHRNKYLAGAATLAAGGALLHHHLKNKEMKKGADLVGTEVMPNSAPYKEKQANMNPYVIGNGMTNSISVSPPERYGDECYCLVKEGEAHFPIKTMGEVQQAIEFFEKEGFQLHPEDRRAYCTKLAAKADALALPLSAGIRKYASSSYAPDGEIKIAVHTRLQFFTDDSPERDLLKGLMEKQGHVQPEVFAEALRLFDETTGLDHYWDEAVYDPYYSTYGFTKEADWSFVSGNDRVTEDQLKKLIQADYKNLKCRFGEEIAEEMAKKPREIFDSLPLDSKRIIMRMANEVGRTKQAI